MSVPDFDGMLNGGITPLGYFKVGYDKNTGNQADAQAFYSYADPIYVWLAKLFPGVSIPNLPIQLLVTTTGLQAGFAAHWNAGNPYQVFLTPNTNVQNLGFLLVEELSEAFMLNAPSLGWFGGTASTEGENGEGLSIYLGRKWALENSYTGYQQVGNNWMNTNPRANTLSAVDANPDYGPKTALNVLFLSYLHYQLGFDDEKIIQHRDTSHSLSKVYQNLTLDPNDPFPLFASLLNNKWPAPQSFPVGVDADNPWPLASVTFSFQQNTFSKDDVNSYLQQATNSGLITDAFAVNVDGFNLQALNAGGSNGSNTKINILLDDAFADITDFPQDLTAQGIRYTTTSTIIPQTISFWYGIDFNSVADFPSNGSNFTKKIEADVSLTQIPFATGSYAADPAYANLVFYSGADPRFQNFTSLSTSPPTNNQYYLSDDLRVFTFAAGLTPTPPGVTFSDPYSYLEAYLNYLNTTYNTPTANGDPFAAGALATFPQNTPTGNDELTNDASVTPFTYQNGIQYYNYNFGIARVRLSGLQGDTASSVKVFFRLWSGGSSPDTWFDTTNIYTTSTLGSLDYPVPAPNDYTFPVFGTLNPTLTDPSNPEFGTTSATPPVATGVNIRDLTVPAGGELWVYYGCFLDLYSTSSPYPTSLLGGAHHCMVAQIDYSASPIINANGQWSTPQNNDKLAQRNLSYVSGGNPVAQTQIIPQVFDITPTTPVPTTAATPLQKSDDLLFDWATVPSGSTANLYWPGVNASDVIALANQWYAYHSISASDTHTLVVTITDTKQTYIPIPTSAGEKFAGLITINLPGTVVKGMEFQVVVKRIATIQYKPQIISIPQIAHQTDISPPESEKSVVTAAAPPQADLNAPYYWRQVIGSFSLRIPIVPHGNLLPAEYDGLAILKWRLTQMPPTNRWYPVIERLIGVTEGRIEGAGGDPNLIPPSGSPTGAPVSVTVTGSGGKGGCDCGTKNPCHHHRYVKHHCTRKKHEKEKCCQCEEDSEPPYHHRPHQKQQCTHKKHEKEKCHECEQEGKENCDKHKSQPHHPKRTPESYPEKLVKIIGKISEIRYDCEGAFCGLVLKVDCCGEEVRVEICERCQSGLTGNIIGAFNAWTSVSLSLDEEGRIEELGLFAQRGHGRVGTDFG